MLIKDEADLKSVLGGVQQTITWETMEPFVKQAEMEFVIPAISEEFYDELCGLENPEGPQLKIIDRLKVSVGYYALVAALPQLVVVVGDAGAAVNTQGGAAMTKWMYVELKNGSLAKADKALENSLLWLEKNQNFEKDGVKVFKTWLDSEVYTISNSLFIHSATELTDFFPSAQGSRRLYLQLKNYLRKVEEYQLKPVLGKAFFDKLKEKSDDEKTTEALNLIKYYLANRAFAEALPFLNINDNFNLISSGSPANVVSEDALDQDRRDGLKINCDDNATNYLNKLKAFLDENASPTFFTEYYNSSQYANSRASKPYERKLNDPSKPYAVF